MQTFTYLVDDQERKVTVEPKDGRYIVTVDGSPYDVSFPASLSAKGSGAGEFCLEIDGRHLRTFIASDAVPGRAASGAKAETRTTVWIDGESWGLVAVDQKERHRKRGSASNGATSGSLIASMPGQVLEVHVTAGDQVDVGDALVMLEAMKMQSLLTASQAGRVAAVNCHVGDVVARGQILVAFE